MIRIAAVGDIHLGTEHAGTGRTEYDGLADHADVLLLAGDLSHRGLPGEADVVVETVGDLGVPVVAVLGNHDLESDAGDEFRDILEDGGIVVLEGEATTVDTPGGSVGIAGTVGFGSGFPGATCAEFGEPEMKAFVARSRALAASLRQALGTLHSADLRVALTHYAPVRATLDGEPPEIYPFLGSFHLEEAIDDVGADLALHGHAHHGSHLGETGGGVPVRNVARPVIGAPYVVFELPVREPA